MKEFISLGKYRRRNTFVLAWGFEYMNLGGCHPRAEALKTDLKRFRISSSSFKTIHGGSESMRGSGLWRWIGEETGNVYRHKANASSGWGQKNASCPAWMLMWALSVGMFLVCVLWRDVSHWGYWLRNVSVYSQDGLHQTNIRLRPFLFCFVILDKQRERERERVIHFSGKTGYGKILQVTTKQTCLTYNNIYKGAQHYVGQTPPWCGPSPIPLACLESLANLLVSLDLSFLRWQVRQ